MIFFNKKYFGCIALVFIFFLTCNSAFTENYHEGSIRTFDIDLPLEEATPSDEPSSEEQENSAEHPLDLLLEKVKKENRIVASIEDVSAFSLPVMVLPPGVDDLSYGLVVDKAEIYPEYALLEAFIILTNPIDNKRIRFRAKNIKLSHDLGLVDGIKLELLDTRTTKIVNDVFLHWLPGTYIHWDCNGFNSIGINGQVELSEKSFQALSLPSFESGGKITTNFFAEFSDFKNFLVELSFPAFKIKGIDEVGFKFTDVVLDFSDKSNADSFVFPSNYPGVYSGEMKNLWRGLFVKRAEIILSPKFNDKQGRTVSFYADELLVDDLGLTGTIGARNILSFGNGNLGDWPFSIAEISMEFLTGKMQAFAFNGELQLPGTSTPLGYDAYLDAASNFHLGISLIEDLEFDMFAAEAVLHPSSRIDVYIEQGRFIPTALLNGSLSFKASNGDSEGSNATINLPSLDFEGLRISAAPPVLDISYIGFSSGSGNGKLANFPVTITEVAFHNRGNQTVEFEFALNINLSPGGGGSIGGSSRVGILTDISGNDWVYKGLNISKISVEASKPGAFSFNGSLMLFENDPVYGKGFRGSVDATFGDTFELEATALFGRVNDYRYFFVDAFLISSKGLPAPPFTINGFGGGLSYRMRQQTSDSGNVSELGKTGSGLFYVPDNGVSLGLTAGIKAGIVNENVVQGEVNFAIIFNDKGGIYQISFTGEAALISPVGNVTEDQIKEISNRAARGQSQNTKTTEPMRARVSILMDFEERIFHTEMEVFINVAGVLNGVGANNRAGWGVFHIEPSKWYLHIGTPTDPVGLSFVGLFETRSYFMAGHDIPDAMQMDNRVLEILKMTQSDFSGDRDPNQLISGNGLAFGTKVGFDTGDLRFLIFYAAFEMGLGFDIMLLDYGPNVYCEGRDGLGINGWYAKGQVYAYVAGKIGLRARVFRRTRTFEILNIQAAAAMRMEGPNPFWMKGVVGGRYRLLGGMIKGSCKFELTVGEKCDMRVLQQDLADLEIIGDVTPEANTDEVDPFVYPQVVFNMPVGQRLKISEDENTTKEFRVNLVEYSLYQGNTRLTGDIEWNEDNTTFAFVPTEVLFPMEEYKAVVSISFDEWDGRRWDVYKNDAGDVHYETREVEFVTGNLPPEIPEDAIAYSYPLNRMMNFYTNEYSKAYIGLHRWIGGYFTPMEGWEQKVRWVPTRGGQVLYSKLTPMSGMKMVETEVPTGLIKGATYHMELINSPLVKTTSIDRNIQERTSQLVDGVDSDEGTQLVTRAAEGLIGDTEDMVFYSIGFRVSQYATLADKIGANELNVTYLHNASPAIDFPTVTVYPNEPFDGYEIESTSNTEPLIRFSAVLEQSDWYLANIFPLLYQGSFFQDAVRKNRDISLNGLPPTSPIYIVQRSFNYIMSEDDIKNQNINSLAEFSQFMYVIPEIWASDYVSIRNEISRDFSDEKRTEGMLKIMNTFPWPQVSAGNYPIRIDYVLPGTNKVSSSHVLNLKNTFEIQQVNLKSNE